jgi:hypothetical protein
MTVDNSFIAFMDQALLKQLAERTLHHCPPREQQ